MSRLLNAARHALGASSLFLAALTSAHAAYPEQPVSLVVPYAAGGPVDVVARILGKELGEILGQSVVVENRGGAGGNIGTSAVARAKPDGYTLLINTPAFVITPLVMEKVPYDPRTDFTPLTQVGFVPALLLTGTDSRFDSVAALIREGKNSPQGLTFGSPGTGTSLHMAGELFSKITGMPATHIPYKGSAPAVTDLIGGRLDFLFDSFVGAYPQVKAGNLRGLAVTTTERYKAAPDIPPLSESGAPGYEFALWYGIFAPAGMPDDLRNQLGNALSRVLQHPETRQQLQATGLEIVGNSPDEFSRQIVTETDKWKALVDSVGLQISR